LSSNAGRCHQEHQGPIQVLCVVQLCLVQALKAAARHSTGGEEAEAWAEGKGEKGGGGDRGGGDRGCGGSAGLLPPLTRSEPAVLSAFVCASLPQFVGGPACMRA
jgi:hypothetical protein